MGFTLVYSLPHPSLLIINKNTIVIPDAHIVESEQFKIKHPFPP